MGRRAEARGDLSIACRRYRSACVAAPQYVPAHLNLAIALETAGQPGAAAESYERALEIDSGSAPANFNLGKLHCASGRLDAAERLLRKALATRPQFPEAHVLLASVQEARGDLAGAARELEAALAQRPGYVGALLNYAHVLGRMRRRAEAIECYERALAAQPALADAQLQVGNLLADAGRVDEASQRFRAALALDPELVGAELSLCLAERARGRSDRAVAGLRRLLARHGGFAPGRVALGELLLEAGQLEDAAVELRAAVAIDPGSAAAHIALGDLLRARGETGEAVRCYRAAAGIDPGNARARWLLAVAELAPVYASTEESERARQAFDSGLGMLERWLEAERLPSASGIVAEPPPFFLAYQAQNNRDLLHRYGTLCTRVMGSQGGASLQRRPPRERPLRVVVASAHLYNHSVWNALLKGWFQRHDPARFELEALSLGAIEDAETQSARGAVSHFETAEGPWDRVAEALAARAPDVMFYPEIGMDSLTGKLASLRIAPVQIATWGHPQTSGLPTIDHFVSAEGLEPTGAAAHYTENLLLLPNLGCTYPSRAVPAQDPDLGGHRLDGVPLLVCPGTPFKYAPDQDRWLVEIARRLGDCRFLFFAYRVPEIFRQLEKRLRSRFAAEGLDPERFLAFLPWQTPAQFRGLMGRADAFLDTIGFSGFNTAMEAVECALPIVASEGRFMRGRLASGILERMKLADLVARSGEEYVDIAVRLCAEDGFRRQARARIRSAAGVLLDDPAPAAELDALLGRLAAQSRSQGA